MKVYLDNCCYNRPYDNQSQLRISLETQAKLFIQDLIKSKKLILATSYILVYENSQNPFEMRKRAIDNFIKSNSSIYVKTEQADIVESRAKIIMKTGIKAKDSLHISCAIEAKCDFFISTDDRLLKFHSTEIKMISPIDFIKIWEDLEHE